MLRACGLSVCGSSPRVWGTPASIRNQEASQRFIPTGVGNTFRRCLGATRRCGSSPRVWGTQTSRKKCSSDARFIPTGVGNTWWNAHRRHWLPVHPHGCGEHSCNWPAPDPHRGSSPRVWGTRIQPSASFGGDRFIPTGVGNTFPKFSRRTINPVHPHGCGEHRRRLTRLPVGNGSSPRVWGTHQGKPPQKRRKRFIPTGVGNTVLAHTHPPHNSVHPHGCGEHPYAHERT